MIGVFDNDNSHQHISRQYDQELLEIRNRVLALGGLVEEQVESAIKALIEGDVALAERVVADDYKVNSMEVAIDEECTQILALRQPTARDLRLVVAVIKTITDLERIGDRSCNICEYVIYYAKGKNIRHISIEQVQEDLRRT